MDDVRDEMIDAALRRAPEVRVPAHFANRVMAQLPHGRVERAESPWVLPALWLAGGATVASLGWAAVSLGIAQWLAQPSVLVGVLSIEVVASLAWIWRVVRSAR